MSYGAAAAPDDTQPIRQTASNAWDPPEDPAQRDMRALAVLMEMAAEPVAPLFSTAAQASPSRSPSKTGEIPHVRRHHAERRDRWAVRQPALDYLDRNKRGARGGGDDVDPSEGLLEAAGTTADPARRRGFVLFTLIFAAMLAGLVCYHWRERSSGFILAPLDFIVFGGVSLFLILAHLHRDILPRGRQAGALTRLRATVVVPLYNEDLATLRQMLKSLAEQTRPVQRIHIVNDGSPLADGPDGEFDDVAAVVNEWRPFMPRTTELRYDRIINSGKRHAQAVAFRADPDADVFVTVDSDTVLDRHAIEYGLAPFCRRRVNAVAGLLLTLNYNANLLTRLIDLSFVTSFLIGRASWSRLSSVTVNCGGLAFYRATVIRMWLEEYLAQTVLGRPVMFGDDRMLTTYALLDGRTVFQQSSVGYTLVPVNLSHLTRQRLRWWRSWGWGNLWIIRHFPVTRIGWWLVAWQFADLALWTIAWPVVLIADPIKDHHFPCAFFVYMAILSYARAAKYLTVRYEGRSFASQFLSFALAPLSGLLSLYVCSALQYPGLATFAKTGWGTRGKVEVGIGESA